MLTSNKLLYAHAPKNIKKGNYVLKESPNGRGYLTPAAILHTPPLFCIAPPTFWMTPPTFELGLAHLRFLTNIKLSFWQTYSKPTPKRALEAFKTLKEVVKAVPEFVYRIFRGTKMEVLHEPQLDTVLMVEKAILDADDYPTRMELEESASKGPVPDLQANIRLSRSIWENNVQRKENHLHRSKQPQTAGPHGVKHPRSVIIFSGSRRPCHTPHVTANPVCGDTLHFLPRERPYSMSGIPRGARNDTDCSRHTAQCSEVESAFSLSALLHTCALSGRSPCI